VREHPTPPHPIPSRVQPRRRAITRHHRAGGLLRDGAGCICLVAWMSLACSEELGHPHSSSPVTLGGSSSGSSGSVDVEGSGGGEVILELVAALACWCGGVGIPALTVYDADGCVAAAADHLVRAC
jgi:hypothetical protein